MHGECVKNNIDPTRSGRLQVWIPDLGGDEDNSKNWRIVSYASPFYGTTYQPTRSKNNKFDEVKHTYGMWFVPPDVGNQVICTFIAGDPNRGFWFACILDRRGQYSLPSHAGGQEGVDFDVSTIKSSALKSAIYSAKKNGSVFMPLTEFNPYKKSSQDPQDRKKAVHEYQAIQYLQQGLANDPVRGARPSSAQRDMPSQVFGISTPGKSASPGKGQVFEREGGSSIVMDDGNDRRLRKYKPSEGPSEYVDLENNEQGGLVNWPEDESFRIRTRTGHQILLHNSEDLIYITNSTGTAWMEFTSNGKIDIYCKDSISIHSEQDFNFEIGRAHV